MACLVSNFKYFIFLAFCFLCLACYYIGTVSALDDDSVLNLYYDNQDIIPLSELQQGSNPDAKSYSDVSKAIYWEHIAMVDRVDTQTGYKEAEKYINEAIKLDPRSSFLHAKLAEASIALKDYDTAKTEVDTAIELNSSNATAHYLSGYLKSIKGQDKSGAIVEFKKATELNPDLYNAQRFLGLLAFDVEDYKLAASAYSQLTRLRPYEPDYRYRLGVAYSELGEAHKAIEELKTAIMLDENHLQAHFKLADLYSIQGKNKEAIEECQFILKHVLNNYNADVMVLLSHLYFVEGEYDKAISVSESILKGRGGSKENIAETYYRLGTIYKEKGDKNLAEANFQKSIDTYQTLLGENSKNVDLNFDIATVYDAKGDYSLAEKYLQRLIVLKPDDPKTYNYLGYMLVEQNKELEKAVTFIQKALVLEPNNGAFHDSLGWAYFKLGKLDDAILELEKAVEFTPDDSDIHEHLGEAYLKKGGEFIQKAVQEWEKSLELKPNKTALRQKLNNLQVRLNSGK